MDFSIFKARSAYIQLFTYLVVITFGYASKSFWFDEVQALGVIASFSSLESFLKYLPHEAQPPLWYALLWIGRVLPEKLLFLFNLFPALMCALFLLTKFPKSRWVCFFSVFGYYGVFEYSLFVRPYALICLLVVYLGHLYLKKNVSTRLIDFKIITALLCLSYLHFWGYFLSVFILVSYLLGKKISYQKGFFTLLLMSTSIYFFHLPSGSHFFPFFITGLSVERHLSVFAYMGSSFLPLPSLQENMPIWNSFWIGHLAPKIFFSTVVLFLVCWELKRRTGALILFLFFFLAMFALFYLKFFGFYRHSGILCLFTLYLFLISQADIRCKLTKGLSFVSVFAGAIFLLSLTKYDFSSSLQIKNALKQFQVTYLYADHTQSALSSVFQTQTKIFSLARNKLTSFYDYSPTPMRAGGQIVSDGLRRSSYHPYLRERDCSSTCFYLSRYLLTDDKNLKLIFSTNKVINNSEQFYLYQYKN